MSMASGGGGGGGLGLEELTIVRVGLKRCSGGMSSPSLMAATSSDDTTTISQTGSIGSIACIEGLTTAGLPRTHSMSALRSRPPRRAIFWEQQCFESPTKRD